jgi:ACS family hexuronate transporter-like MFS transporter
MQLGASAWSLAAIAHGWATTTAQVVAARVGLGVTEAVQTPLTIKTVATLFDPNWRSLAFGVSTFLASAGTIAMPFIVPTLAEEIGWRGALVVGGVGGLVSLALWLLLARGIVFAARDADMGSISALPQAAEPNWPIMAQRATWGIVLAKALSDMTWWFINFWLADYYRKAFNLSTAELALPLGIAFAGSGIGALLAGGISSLLLSYGWSVNRVRKTVMFVSALMVAPMPFVAELNSFWPVAIMMGVVMAGHQGFSLSIFATITDVVPNAKVARVTAFGAFAGNMGGVAISLIAGRVLDAGWGFAPLFVFAVSSYFVALGLYHLAIPVVRPLAPPPAETFA